MKTLRRIEGACPRCNRLRTRVGCKCAPPPANFPVRDSASGAWVDPTTGELITKDRPPPPAPEQLELFGPDASVPLVIEGLAALRAALKGRK